MLQITRRKFLRAGAAAAAVGMGIGAFQDWGSLVRAGPPPVTEVPLGERPAQDKSVEVLHPRGRVPLGFIIDDSTVLANLGHFCMPQFNAAFPQNPSYWKQWQKFPREISNEFMREFGEFCGEQGVRGKFSLVPYPACVGWLDRELPGWPRKQLQEGLKIVRELIAPRFDITPEMITHTRVIDIKTGRPMQEISGATIENSYPPEAKSADELAEYIAFALRILKNCDIPCEAITTPGGFGNKCKSALSLAVGQAVKEVFAPEIPHYFKYISGGDESTRPRLEHVRGLDGDNPQFTVNVPAGTGDWFGNWDGDNPPQGQKYANDDATAGRMVELIERGEPAVMFGHWAGLYSHGSKKGFEAAKKVITALNTRFRDQTIWMKTAEMARYWAARELTRIERQGSEITLSAPFAAPSYTLRITGAGTSPPKLTREGKVIPVTETTNRRELTVGTWLREKVGVIVCFDLPKGKTLVNV